MRFLSRWISRRMYPFDLWAHDQDWLPKPVERFICDVAELSYGWGPGALDWEERKRWWMPAVYDFFWPGGFWANMVEVEYVRPFAGVISCGDLCD